MLVDGRRALVCVSGRPMMGLLGAPPSIASHVVSLFRYFHPGSDPLELDSRFWEIRDSIVQCELLVLRVLRFQVSFQHPHKVRVAGVGRRAAVTYGSQRHESLCSLSGKCSHLSLEPHGAPRRHSDARVACLIPTPRVLRQL